MVQPLFMRQVNFAPELLGGYRRCRLFLYGISPTYPTANNASSNH